MAVIRNNATNKWASGSGREFVKRADAVTDDDTLKLEAKKRKPFRRKVSGDSRAERMEGDLADAAYQNDIRGFNDGPIIDVWIFLRWSNFFARVASWLRLPSTIFTTMAHRNRVA